MSKTPTYRIEQDELGERQVPVDVYYGIQTLRAIERFSVSQIKPWPIYVDACILVKKAAAIANAELGYLDQAISHAIVQACDDLLRGDLRDQIVVELYQSGADTALHQNVNEVLANRALDILGQAKGHYQQVSPDRHVSYGQSAYDVMPTTIRVAGLLALEHSLYPPLSDAIAALDNQADRFKDVRQPGYLHLRPGGMMAVGEVFKAWAQILTEHLIRIETASGDLTLLGLGGYVGGPEADLHPQYPLRMASHLSELVGLPLRPAPHFSAALQSMAPFVGLSGALRNLAQDLVKLAQDLRLRTSDLQAGMRFSGRSPNPGDPGEQGTSVSDVAVLDMVSMVGFQVMGCDQAIALAAQAGQLEANVMTPLIAHNLIQSIELLGNAVAALTEQGLTRLTATGA